MKIKKSINLIIAAVMSLTMLVGCTSNSGGSSSAGSDSSSSASADLKTKFKGEDIIIYIRMMDAQDKWFRENTIEEFKKEYGVNVTVKTFESEADLMNILKLDSERGSIGIIKTPLSSVNAYKKGDYIMAIDDVNGINMKEVKDYFSESAIDSVTFDDKVWAIPRKGENYTLVYLKDKVADAVANWEKQKTVIEAAFKAENGVGLPKNYELESDPNKWDWYDLAVVGMYWGNTEIDGKTQPRIAHRTKVYEGTSIEIMTKVYQMGGTPDDMLDPTSPAVVETMKWEAFDVKNNIYNPTMWKEMWSGGGIWNGFASGDVYMAFMSQMDEFFIHGGSNPDMQGYLTDPDNMGVALLPAGASLELNDKGEPAIMGESAAFDNGWYWAIPKTAPNPELSMALINFISSEKNHTAEASTFGILPVTNDVLDNIDTLMKEDWMKQIFNVGKEQASKTLYSVPDQSKWPEISSLWQQGWHDIALTGDTSKVEAGLENLKTKIEPLLDK